MLEVDDLEPPQRAFTEKENIEYKLHVAIVDHVTGRKVGQKAFNAFICHVFQGRNKQDGFFLKMLGVVPGIADLLVLWRAKCDCGKSKVGIGFLEVKKSDGYQSGAQKKFQGVCHWLGINYAVVKSVGQAHKMLVLWGCPEFHSTVVEPDLRSQKQKFDDARSFYAPD